MPRTIIVIGIKAKELWIIIFRVAAIIPADRLLAAVLAICAMTGLHGGYYNSSWRGDGGGLAVVMLYHCLDVLGHHALYRLAGGDAAAYLGAAHGVQVGMDVGDRGRHGGGIDLIARPRIDGYAVVGDDILAVGPAVERQPVVGADEQGEAGTGMQL